METMMAILRKSIRISSSEKAYPFNVADRIKYTQACKIRILHHFDFIKGNIEGLHDYKIFHNFLNWILTVTEQEIQMLGIK